MQLLWTQKSATSRAIDWLLIQRILARLRAIAIWGIWLSLIAIWIATLVSLSQTHYWASAALIISLLYILFFAEGLELAVTDLLDKHPDQLRDSRLRRLLQDLQRRKDFFLAQRQVFVVVIISLMSLLTAYPYIYVPFFGIVTDFELPFWFSLALTTLTVLSFCQVTPKRLAVMNSELFLRQSGFLWPLIKITGIFGLPCPSDDVVNFCERHTRYRLNRHLRPSPAALYNTTSHIYGMSQDRIGVEISINNSGYVTIRKRFAILFLHGARKQHTDKLYLPMPFSSSPRVEVVGLFTGPAPERLEMISSELDAIFLDGMPTQASKFKKVENWPHTAEIIAKDDLFRGGQWASWVVWSGRPMPEAFWSASGNDESLPMPLCALVYDVTIEAPQTALTSPLDQNGIDCFWAEHITSPCRILTLRIASDGRKDTIGIQGCDVRLFPGEIPVPEETLRCTELAISTQNQELEFRYPLQGAVYSLRWWQFDGCASASLTAPALSSELGSKEIIRLEKILLPNP